MEPSKSIGKVVLSFFLHMSAGTSYTLVGFFELSSAFFVKNQSLYEQQDLPASKYDWISVKELVNAIKTAVKWKKSYFVALLNSQTQRITQDASWETNQEWRTSYSFILRGANQTSWNWGTNWDQHVSWKQSNSRKLASILSLPATTCHC